MNQREWAFPGLDLIKDRKALAEGSANVQDLFQEQVMRPRPLEDALEMRIFGMKESSKGLLQFLRETQVGLARDEASAQAERERRMANGG